MVAQPDAGCQIEVSGGAIHFAGTVRNEQGQSSNVNLTLVSGPGGRNYLL